MFNGLTGLSMVVSLLSLPEQSHLYSFNFIYWTLNLKTEVEKPS